MDYIGGFITKNPVAPTDSAASGVWRLNQALQYTKAGTWPVGNYYLINRSVRTRASASAYFSRTIGTPTNNKICTLSVWLKRGALQSAGSMGIIGTSGGDYIDFNNDNIEIRQLSGGGGRKITTAVFRDPSAWYHFVFQLDTTDATAANRIKIWQNGVQLTSFSTSTDPSLNSTWSFNVASAAVRLATDFSSYFDGYLTEMNFIDGQSLTPTSFGAFDATTGVWNPIAYTGTYGNNGFYLNFKDATSTTTIGYDYSGNSNNWTSNNVSVTAGATYDSMVDVPTNYGADTGVGGTVRGDYCVMNPVAKNSRITAANGNLQVTGDNTANHQIIYGTFPLTTGKWYWEVVVNNATTSTVNIVGIQSYIGFADGTYCASSGNGIGWGYTTTIGNFYSSNFTVSGTAPVLANGTIGIAYDADAGKIWFRNTSGSWVQGDPAAGTSPTGTVSTTATTMMPAVSFYSSNGAWSFNFGQQAFSYTAPSGFKALCTQNYSTPTISNGANYMAATLYTGTGSSQTVSNAVNSISFQPDLVWIKSRSAATNNKLTDSVRGTTKALISDTTGAETTDTNGLTAFGSTGFTVGTDTNYNNSGATYVGWNWKGGGTAVSNTSGSITSSVSANPTAGFSVVTYTGTGANATVGHGIGAAPSMVILKNRSGANGWTTYQAFQNASPASGYVQINSTAGFTAFSLVFNNTAPTSSVFSVGTDTSTNANTNTYVAYCFAPIAGYSAFGSYTGNGSTDGTFTYLGFKPRFVMFKRTDSTGSWFMEDSSRGTYNVMGPELYANLSDAEATSNRLDFLSNGFKMRAANAGDNANGGTYIYAAFAENPFKIARAR